MGITYLKGCFVMMLVDFIMIINSVFIYIHNIGFALLKDAVLNR